ncbi:MAG: NADPH-dependent curcumin reductase [Candidatus Celerinatantimonas neptuna]|nr:MAG: NADPH-dependent curcumin reductase [Candidatus Celerinatantimonas neptuna]
MTQLINRSIVLKSHPEGPLRTDNFELIESEVPALMDGQFLVENQWLSMDPYVRPRLNPKTPMVNPIPLGAVIQGDCVGIVKESKNPDFQQGDWVSGLSGWQQYDVCDQNSMMGKIPETSLSKSIFLGAVGSPGQAAWLGLSKIGKPKAGETVVVSAAGGAVGSVAGQIAKMKGCYVVGIAGGEEKCQYVVDEFGFDCCVDYKSEDFKKQLRKACPKGVDVYFENVGGKISMLVAQLLNDGARVPVCGTVSQYDKGKSVDSQKVEKFFASLPNSPVAQFFIVTQWVNEMAKVNASLIEAIEEGHIKIKETIHQGLENTPQAFIDMLNGRHIGKQLVRL